MFAALKAYGAEGQGDRQVRMITVTGQGSEGLPWDEDHCAHLGEHRHSGRLGCRVLPAAADAYNAAAPAWWTELHRQARQAAKRAVGCAPSLLVRVWELQKRGILHLHLVVGYSTLEEKRAADRYVEELSSRAARHGFGFVDRKREVKQPTAAAAYLSSYFVAGRKGKVTLTETVQSERMPRSIVYVAPRLSQLSGLTMRSLRLKRFLWRRLSGFDWLKKQYRIEDLYRAWCAGVGPGQLIEALMMAPQAP